MSSEFVQHLPENGRFEVARDGKVAFVEYLDKGDAIVLTHTWVPPEMRGGGVAGLLVRAALIWARDQKKGLVPQCSYGEAYLQRHPEFADLLA
ncbi:GNAT family N-acetyltransferase [soil metagenome]